MSHSSPEGIELSKGSNLESFSLSINKEKVLELKQQERMYSEEESIQKIIDYVDFQFNTNGELNSEIKKWFNQFKKK